MATLLATGFWLTVGACNDTAASSGPDAAAGVYSLQTIDGQALPGIIDQQGSDLAEVIEGSVTLRSNRTFDDTTVLRLTISGVVSTETDADAGSWTLSGRTVEFTPSDQSGPYAMTWDGGDQLAQDFNGFLLVYRRSP